MRAGASCQRGCQAASGPYDWGVSGSELPREQWADVCSQVCVNRRVRKGLRDLMVTERRTGRVKSSAASRDEG